MIINAYGEYYNLTGDDSKMVSALKAGDETWDAAVYG